MQLHGGLAVALMRASDAERSAVRWLTAQAVAFGVMAALLGIVASALFLEEYGAAWLPVTYLFIALAGIAVSGAVARSARSGDLLRIAVTVLAGAVAVLLAAWIVAAGGDGAWVSGPLLVLFPVLLQLGFVFIGGQAGRVLDIGGIKAHFPRIIAGFPVGAVVGGLIAPPMLAVFGRSEHLLLASAVAQAAFLGLLVGTGRRFATRLAPISRATTSAGAPRPSFRQLLGSRFVLLIIAYQVLSAVGSQLSDFLVFDRAAARYDDGEDLARFVAWYTAAMNVTSILFLALLAGVLLRRFGLRLGLVANPAVLAVLAVGMVAASATAGGGSVVLLAAVSIGRIADIALTDGTTRTAINATYQVLPDDERLAVQASVEGVGVPVAIGASGVLILVLDALPIAVAAMVTVTAVVCAVWTWVALVLYREYAATLVRALTRPSMLHDDVALDGDDSEEAAARTLLASGDERDVGLGVEMLTAMASPALTAELGKLARDPRPDVRSAALVRLAAAGDDAAHAQLRVDVQADRGAVDPDARRRAARAVAALDTTDRASAGDLLRDVDAGVRCAALDSVRAGDEHALDAVVSALADPATSAAAALALERLGDATAPAVRAVLDTASSPAPPLAGRVVRAARFTTAELAHEVLGGHVDHPDRELGLTVLERLASASPPPAALCTELDRLLRDDAFHAARIARAMRDLLEIAPAGSALHRALADELDLVQRRVAAGLLVRYGTDALASVLLALSADDVRRGLAIEALEVTLPRADAALAVPVLRTDASPAERAAMLPPPPGRVPSDVAGWIDELITDANGEWRCPWVRACAIDTAAAAGLAASLDLEQLTALADPLVDEVLASAVQARSGS